MTAYPRLFIIFALATSVPALVALDPGYQYQSQNQQRQRTNSKLPRRLGKSSTSDDTKAAKSRGGGSSSAKSSKSSKASSRGGDPHAQIIIEEAPPTMMFGSKSAKGTKSTKSSGKSSGAFGKSAKSNNGYFYADNHGSDADEVPFEKMAVEPTTPSPTYKPTSSPTKRTIRQIPSKSCTGLRCQSDDSCRSRYGNCGAGFMYCNAYSTWKSSCPAPESERDGTSSINTEEEEEEDDEDTESMEEQMAGLWRGPDEDMEDVESSSTGMDKDSLIESVPVVASAVPIEVGDENFLVNGDGDDGHDSSSTEVKVEVDPMFEPKTRGNTPDSEERNMFLFWLVLGIGFFAFVVLIVGVTYRHHTQSMEMQQQQQPLNGFTSYRDQQTTMQNSGDSSISSGSRLGAAPSDFATYRDQMQMMQTQAQTQSNNLGAIPEQQQAIFTSL
mmetsp:Transcript_18614/g.39134  ORF Transcript_18614/g.39134 Transcript_18614/m.39134 type:complete len:442 (+) Transcript_18614:239-1564(+)